MEASIQLDIISPEKTLVSEKVGFVTMPGIAGNFEVLKDHAPLITALDAGVICYGLPGEEKKLAIKSGFVEVRDNYVTICVEEAEE